MNGSGYVAVVSIVYCLSLPRPVLNSTVAIPDAQNVLGSSIKFGMLPEYSKMHFLLNI
jgi:hypothetical protein